MGKQSRVFTTDKDDITLSNPKFPWVMSPEDKILKAEIVQALNYVESNYSYHSASNDNEKFRLLFPDSQIAEGYSQSSTKIKWFER